MDLIFYVWYIRMSQNSRLKFFHYFVIFNFNYDNRNNSMCRFLYGNRRKSSLKKSPINFGTEKVLWIKSPWNKKSLEIKSYHFETFFSIGLFFWFPSMFLVFSASKISRIILYLMKVHASLVKCVLSAIKILFLVYQGKELSLCHQLKFSSSNMIWNLMM